MAANPSSAPESDPASDIWLIPTEGGAAIPLAGPDKPYGRVFNDGFYGRVAFSPDGRRLVFVADDGKDPRTPEEVAAGVEVVRPDQGEGYTGYGRAQVWVAHLEAAPDKFAAGRIEGLIRKDDAWYGDPHWSPDGRSLVVHANRTADRESVRYSINKDYDLWQIDSQTGALRQLTSGPGPEVCPRFSPDGKRLACLSIPRKGSHFDVFNLAVVTLGESGPSTQVLFDHHGPAADQPSHPAPLFPLPEDCWNGNSSLIYQAAKGINTSKVRVKLQDGKGSELAPAEEKTRKRLDGDQSARKAQRLKELLPRENPFLQDRLTAESRG